jgi:hypothetical protein
MYIVKHIVVFMVTIRTPIAFQTLLLWLLFNLQQSFIELGLNLNDEVEPQLKRFKPADLMKQHI